VVRVSERPEVMHEVGVKFLRAGSRFRGLEFPPDDWKKDRAAITVIRTRKDSSAWLR